MGNISGHCLTFTIRLRYGIHTITPLGSNDTTDYFIIEMGRIILSASPHITLDACLKRLGLWELFDNIWPCDDFHTTKADPKLYVLATQALHTSVENVLFLDNRNTLSDYYIYDFTQLLT